MCMVPFSVNGPSVCIVSAEPLGIAQSHSEFLKCPVNPPRPEEYFFQVHIEGSRIYVRDGEKRTLEIDFDKNHLDYQRKGHRGKNELIAKALGYSKGCRKVLDLSVGLGIDSVFLSQLGFQVTGVERSPLLYVLLQNAFAHSAKEELRGYQLFHDESLNFLRTQKGKIDIDAIYFDPMYPHKKKSALPKQEMVIFRDLVGSDEDAADVLREALSWPVRRVVVKRPLNAEELMPGVMHSFKGKVVRYDTYVVG